jgi:hypothetical protein
MRRLRASLIGARPAGVLDAGELRCSGRLPGWRPAFRPHEPSPHRQRVRGARHRSDFPGFQGVGGSRPSLPASRCEVGTIEFFSHRDDRSGPKGANRRGAPSLGRWAKHTREMRYTAEALELRAVRSSADRASRSLYHRPSPARPERSERCGRQPLTRSTSARI